MKSQERKISPSTWFGGLSGPSISISFELQVAIAFPPMHGTAVISLFTRHGIVIAADGFRKGVKDGAVKSLKAQKIYHLETNRGTFAYALSGYTGDGTFDFATEVGKAAKGLSSTSAKDLTDYGQQLGEIISQALLETIPEGSVEDFRNDPEFFVRLTLTGYYDGIPDLVHVTLCHKDPQPLDLKVKSDFVQLGPMISSGANECATNAFFKTDAPEFKKYKPACFDKMKAAQPVSLREAAEIVAGYIRACMGPEIRKLDPRCESIDGHIHIAAVIPSRGFQWIVKPLQDETNIL